MARVEDLDQIKSKGKAIVALFPYAAWRQRGGDHRMVEAFLGVFKVPNVVPFMGQSTTKLLGDACPGYPNWVVTLVSPHIYWGESGLNGNTVTWWAAAALATPYTEEVGQSVVDTLLQVAYVDGLGPYIPVDIWALLKKQPSLPPVCVGRKLGTRDHVIRRVRKLGDVDILTSFLLLVWSEWNPEICYVRAEMCTSIREDLAGIEMGHHREVLVERLDHTLGQLDRGLEHLTQQASFLDDYDIRGMREEYRILKEVLLEVDGEALEILTRTPSKLIDSFDSLTFPQIPTRRSFVPSLSRVRSRTPITLAPYSPNSVLHFHTVPTLPPLRALSTVSIIDHHPTLQTYASPAISRHEKRSVLASSVEGGSAGGRVVHIIISVFSILRNTTPNFMPLLSPLFRIRSRIFLCCFSYSRLVPDFSMYVVALHFSCSSPEM